MTEQSVMTVAIDSIVCRRQVRESFSEEDLLGLAQSIKEQGILHPLLGHREGKDLILDDGERRLRAARLAGLKTVPVLVESRSLKACEVLQRQLVSNCQRQDLSAMEKARAIDRLMEETGWKGAEAAAKLGLSTATVSRSLALLTLPTEVQGQVERGELAASTAYQIASSGEGAAEQERLAGEAASGKLSREAIAGRKRQRTGDSDKARAKASSRVSATLGAGRRVSVSGPGLASVETLIEWLEELLARARKSRRIELATFVALLRDEARTQDGGS